MNNLDFIKNIIEHKQCYNCALNKKCERDDPYYEPIGSCSKWSNEDDNFFKEEKNCKL